MTAAMMPSSSLSGSSNLANGSPPYSTCTPVDGRLLVAEVLDLLAEVGTSVKLRSLIDSDVKAIVPFSLICCGFWSGLTTVTPCCWAAKSADRLHLGLRRRVVA